MENENLSLKDEFNYYVKNLDELVKKYENRYIVIKNNTVLGSYESFEQAIIETKRIHEVGTFLVRKCDSNKENFTQTFHSRVNFIN